MSSNLPEKLRKGWRNAFSLKSPHGPLTERDFTLLDKLAEPYGFSAVCYRIFILIPIEIDPVGAGCYTRREFSLPDHVGTEITFSNGPYLLRPACFG